MDYLGGGGGWGGGGKGYVAPPPLKLLGGGPGSPSTYAYGDTCIFASYISN